MNTIRFLIDEYYTAEDDLPPSQLVSGMDGGLSVVSLAALSVVIFEYGVEDGE